MVELYAIRLSVLSVNGSLKTARTVLQIAGVALMAIEGGNADPAVVRQRLVAFQPVIDVVDPLPQSLGIHRSVDTSDSVGAADGLPEPALEEAGASGEFQSVETAHARPEQNNDGLEDDGRRNTRLQAPVDNAGDNRPGETEDLLGIRDQAAENVSAPLTENVSTPARKLRPADAESPGTRRPPPGPGPATPRHTDLPYLARLALHEIQRPVSLAFGATTSGFPAFGGALGQRTVQESSAGGELGDT